MHGRIKFCHGGTVNTQYSTFLNYIQGFQTMQILNPYGMSFRAVSLWSGLIFYLDQSDHSLNHFLMPENVFLKI